MEVGAGTLPAPNRLEAGQRKDANATHHRRRFGARGRGAVRFGRDRDGSCRRALLSCAAPALSRRSRLGNHRGADFGADGHARRGSGARARSGGLFALSIAAPIALLTHLALLSRPVPAAESAPSTRLEWYPPGRLVGWAAIIAGLLAALLVLVLGYDQESYEKSIREVLSHSALKDLDTDGTLFTEENLAKIAGLIAWVLPAAFAIVWLTITLFNLWIAGRILDVSGHALRPWPDLHALELPNAFVMLFAGALAASFLPGVAGLLATGLAGALLFAYALQGLAVIHVYSQGMPLRGLLLATVYLAILFLGWVVIVVAIIGLAEPSLGLRRRAAQSGQPPKPGGTI